MEPNKINQSGHARKDFLNFYLFLLSLLYLVWSILLVSAEHTMLRAEFR